jgi:AcrR family transcriptional regulator
MIVLVRGREGGQVTTSTRERIVTGTAALLQRQGYAGTGFKQIGVECGATVGSMYHFFPGGKEELAATALRWAAGGYAELVGAVLDAAPDPVSAVSAAFEGAAETLRATGYADACPIATVALEVASSNEPLRVVTGEIFEGWLRALDARFRAAGIADDRARDLSTLFLAALEGGFLLSRAARDTAPMLALGRSVADAVAAALAEAPGAR